MKQRITSKQLEELSKKGKQKLEKWWKQKKYLMEGDTCMCGGSFTVCKGHQEWMDSTKEPLLSIGQMIEFLVDNKKQLEVILGENIDYDLYGLYPVKNWCNILWKACKEILNE